MTATSRRFLPADPNVTASLQQKQELAAIRHLFDWLVTGQVVSVNPAASVRGPRHVGRDGDTQRMSVPFASHDHPRPAERRETLPPFEGLKVR